MHTVFALLDDASAEGHAQARSRLYSGHAGTLRCEDAAGWPPLLEALQDALGRGLYAVPLLSYELGAHLDICWYEVPRRDGDPPLSGLELIAEPGATLAVLGQAASWQLGYTIPAGTFPELRAGGIGPVVGALRRRLPWLGDRLDGLTEVNQLSLLPVRITRTDRWSEPGLLLIGDAAHVISPVGGNGVNFAVLDAVEAANRLVGPLLADPVQPTAVDAATAAVEADPRRRRAGAGGAA